MREIGDGCRCAWCGATLDEVPYVGSAIATVIVRAGEPDACSVVFDGREIHRCERRPEPE